MHHSNNIAINEKVYRAKYTGEVYRKYTDRGKDTMISTTAYRGKGISSEIFQDERWLSQSVASDITCPKQISERRKVT